MTAGGRSPVAVFSDGDGAGARMGPGLTHEAQRHPDITWQAAHLKDPAKLHPGSGMPAYADLKPQELNALASFLATRQ